MTKQSRTVSALAKNMGQNGPEKWPERAKSGSLGQKTWKPQKICEKWVLLVFHGQNCWGIISKGFLMKYVGIWEFGHILGFSPPLCGRTWSVMKFRNVRWVQLMIWGPGPYKVIIEKWPRIQREGYMPHLNSPLKTTEFLCITFSIITPFYDN